MVGRTRVEPEILPFGTWPSPVTADLLTQRIQVHEKTAWMLRSLLDT